MEDSFSIQTVDGGSLTPALDEETSPMPPEVSLEHLENVDDRRDSRDERLGASSAAGGSNDANRGEDDDVKDEEEDGKRPRQQQRLKYTKFADKAFFFLNQTAPPRSWCLALITWSYPLVADNIMNRPQ